MSKPYHPDEPWLVGSGPYIFSILPVQTVSQLTLDGDRGSVVVEILLRSLMVRVGARKSLLNAEDRRTLFPCLGFLVFARFTRSCAPCPGGCAALSCCVIGDHRFAAAMCLARR